MAATATPQALSNESIHQVRGLRIRENLVWTLVGNAIYMGCQWGVLVTAVKVGTPEMVGQLSLGFAIGAPIFLLSQLRLRAASATDARFEYGSADYLALRMICTLGALLCIAAICVIGRFSESTASIVMCVAIAKAIESGSDVLYGLSQNVERMHSIACSMILRGCLSLSGFYVVLSRTHRLFPALCALCLAWGIVLIAYDLPQTAKLIRKMEGRRIHLQWNWPVLWDLAKLTAPLGVSAMLTAFAINMPRYFIEHALGSRELGIFAALGYLTIAGGVVVNSLSEATVPRFAKYFALGQTKSANRLLWWLVLITAALGMIGVIASMVFGKKILTTIYRPDYAAETNLLVLLMWATALANVSSVFNYVLLAARWFRTYLASLIVLTAIIAMGCSIAIPRWGLRGAAFACLAGFASQLLVCSGTVWWLMKSSNKQAANQPEVAELFMPVR